MAQKQHNRLLRRACSNHSVSIISMTGEICPWSLLNRKFHVDTAYIAPGLVLQLASRLLSRN